MDEFRAALVFVRIIALLLMILGGCWFLAWAMAAVNDWVLTGTLSSHSASFRLSWSTYAMVDIIAGLVLARFAPEIAKFATRP